MYYKSLKVTIKTPRLIEVIINIVVWHHGLLDAIISDRKAIFNLSSGSCSVISLALKNNSPLNLLSDKWANKMTKQHNESIFLCLCKLEVE